MIIYRLNGKGQVEVLMGERHRKHRFQPQRYVFPGGVVDPTDSRVRGATPIRRDVEAMLNRTATPARSRGLIAAAVRETFEEAGLVLGDKDPEPGRGVPQNWQEFFATGMAPAFGQLDYVARAVTPPIRPMRFNARFFMVDARYAIGDLKSNGELLNLTYVSLEDTRDLDMPRITAKILTHVEDLVLNPPPVSMDRTITFYHHRGGSHVALQE